MHFAALLCAGIFTGAAVYISLVQQPAARQAGVAGRLFPAMYARAAPLRASMALIGAVTGLIASLTGAGGGASILGALVLFAVVTYTLIRIKPVNDELNDPSRDPDASDTLELLDSWNRMHHLRSIAGAVAFLCYLAG